MSPGFMLDNYFHQSNELLKWKYEELYNGNRIKASKIARIAVKMKLKHDKWIEKQLFRWI